MVRLRILVLAKFAARCNSAGCFLFALLFFSCGCNNPETPSKSSPPEPPAPLEAVPTESVLRKALVPSSIVRDISTREPRADDWFEQVENEVGLEFSYSDGSSSGFYQIVESVGGGLVVADLDLDGWQDVFLTGGGTLSRQEDRIELSGSSSALFRNQAGRFENTTEHSLLLDDSLYTHGCTAIDINVDGFPDLIVAGYSGVQAWVNIGDGTFVEESFALGLTSPRWNVVPAAADINNDGLPDLYVVTYAEWKPSLERLCRNDKNLRDVCGPTLFDGQPDQLFRNNGESFENVSREFGLVPANRGLGIIAVDFDMNGRTDFVVVNDVQENQCYLNINDGPFREQGVLAGIAYSSSGGREGSMGVNVCDFDRNGWPDLWYTNYANQDNSLMRNVDGTGFVYASDSVELGGVSRRWVGFGTFLADFNGDGWEDIFVANGHVAYERLDGPYYQPPQLFQNRLGKSFVELKDHGGPYFSIPRAGRGAATVDFDNDGNLDFIVVHQNEPVAVLRNRNVTQNWLRLCLVGKHSERSGVGAMVSVVQNSRSSTLWRVGGGSYLSHGDARLLFTLDTDSTVTAKVSWLGGETESFQDLLPNRTYILLQDRGSYVVP